MNSESLPLEVDCQTVNAKLQAGEDFLLLDCREPDEHQIAHIPAATLLPMSELMDRAGELEPHRHLPIVEHCHRGGRSMQVALWLRQQGFPQSQSMAGGIDQWAELIDPTVARY